MNELITYVLKVLAIQGVFFTFYWLFLKRTSHHSLNRWYLLSALILAFIIPFLALSMPEEAPELVQENPVLTWFAEPSVQEFEIIPVKVESAFSWWSLLPWAYGLVTLILMVRSTFYLSVLHKLKRHSEPIKKRGFTLFKTSQNRSFSFFSNVFIPRWLFGTDAFDQVLAHECVHVRQLHSLDRLLLDFVVSLFWFNPFIYWYRNALIEVHEYQADEAVIEEFQDPIAYQEIIYSQLQSPQFSGFVSHFNFQMIKKRIVMMNKQKKKAGWMYLITIPVTLFAIFAFSSKEAIQPIDKVGEELSAMVGPMDEVGDYAAQFFQRNDEPSILPFGEETITKMTSGFGMRMHPIERVKKFHRGMDFRCDTGTEIIATADGVVKALRDNPSGHGKMVIIAHENGFITRYAQLSAFKVSEGDKVEKGQVIALSGNSGMSTGPHLHYEVIKDGEAVDPKEYIKNYEFKVSAVKHGGQLDHVQSHGLKAKKSTEQQKMLAKKEADLAEMNDERTVEQVIEGTQAVPVAQERSQALDREASKGRQLTTASGFLVGFEYGEQEQLLVAYESGIFGDKLDPLFIWDGDEIERSDLLAKDPQNIKTAVVFKDEKAFELYGEKGKNGVIVFESKRSKKGKKRKVKAKSKRKSKLKRLSSKRSQMISKRSKRMTSIIQARGILSNG